MDGMPCPPFVVPSCDGDGGPRHQALSDGPAPTHLAGGLGTPHGSLVDRPHAALSFHPLQLHRKHPHQPLRCGRGESSHGDHLGLTDVLTHYDAVKVPRYSAAGAGRAWPLARERDGGKTGERPLLDGTKSFLLGAEITAQPVAGEAFGVYRCVEVKIAEAR